MVKIIINVVLTLLVIALSWYLYTEIQEPIEFEKAKTKRYAATIERLKLIREAQKTYKDLHGEYAVSFEKLIGSIKKDSLAVISIEGDPDLAAEDSTYIVVRDTSYVALMDKYMETIEKTELSTEVSLDSLPYIPYTNGEKFDINAGEIKSNRITINVFEAGASESVVLKGLNEQYIDYDHRIQVGSMYEGTITGNWE